MAEPSVDLMSKSELRKAYEDLRSDRERIFNQLEELRKKESDAPRVDRATVEKIMAWTKRNLGGRLGTLRSTGSIISQFSERCMKECGI